MKALKLEEPEAPEKPRKLTRAERLARHDQEVAELRAGKPGWSPVMTPAVMKQRQARGFQRKSPANPSNPERPLPDPESEGEDLSPAERLTLRLEREQEAAADRRARAALTEVVKVVVDLVWPTWPSQVFLAPVKADITKGTPARRQLEADEAAGEPVLGDINAGDGYRLYAVLGNARRPWSRVKGARTTKRPVKKPVKPWEMGSDLVKQKGFVCEADFRLLLRHQFLKAYLMREPGGELRPLTGDLALYRLRPPVLIVYKATNLLRRAISIRNEYENPPRARR